MKVFTATAPIDSDALDIPAYIRISSLPLTECSDGVGGGGVLDFPSLLASIGTAGFFSGHFVTLKHQDLLLFSDGDKKDQWPHGSKTQRTKRECDEAKSSALFPCDDR